MGFVLLPLVFGIVQFGFAFAIHSGMQNAAREGARYLSMGGHLPDDALEQRIQDTYVVTYEALGSAWKRFVDQNDITVAAQSGNASVSIDIPLQRAMIVNFLENLSDNQSLTVTVTMGLE